MDMRKRSNSDWIDAKVGRSGKNRQRQGALDAGSPFRGARTRRMATLGDAQEASAAERSPLKKEVGKFADKPGSVEHRRQAGDIGQSFLWAPRYRGALAAYPGATRATPMLPYLALPRMGFAVPVLLPVLR